MGRVFNGIHRELALKLKQVNKAEVFIETGTYIGNTSKWASEYFKKVHTIETNKEFYKRALKTLSSFKNVQCSFEDSVDGLRKLRKKIDSNVLFWLDAHASSTDNFDLERECPLLEELEIVNQFTNSIIMIDDARYFLSPPPDPWHWQQWPNIQSILQVQTFNDNTVYVIDDVIISVPAYYTEQVSQFLKTYKKQRNEK